MSKRKKKTHKKKTRKKQRIHKWQKTLTFLIPGILLVVGGFGYILFQSKNVAQEPSPSSRRPEIPQRILSLEDPWIREAYIFAYTHPQAVSYIPCFCGCDRLGHGSLKDCYLVPGIFGGYSITSHAEHCNICLNLAHKTKNMLAQGMDITDIRRRIDSEFARYGQATPTPYPALNTSTHE